MDQKREPAFEVTIDQDDSTITIYSPKGLNDRAMRDITRMQWITVGYGWDLTDRNEGMTFTRAKAKFLPEEFISAGRYFDFVNQGISVTRRVATIMSKIGKYCKNLE